MGILLLTIKIMPKSVKTDLHEIEQQAQKIANTFKFTISKIKQEPVAFGLIALFIYVSVDENTTNLDAFEDELRNLDNVASVEITDMRRGIG